MFILIIHNKYGRHSGEESVVYAQEKLLTSNGHRVQSYFRSSETIAGIKGQTNAFFSGFFNRKSYRDIEELLQNGPVPDIIHIHNLYPLISPAVLHLLRRNGIPIVMTVHNYRLICPNGLYFTHGEICERCNGGREWNCILRNCERSLFKSTGYALRNAFARLRGSYRETVSKFICLTDFQRGKLAENGFPSARITVIPNFSDSGLSGTEDRSSGDHGIFVGRLNNQKGFDLLVDAMKILEGASNPYGTVRIIAAGKEDPDFIRTLDLPGNILRKGNLDPGDLENLYLASRFLVFCSKSYEGFPMVFLEAMKYGIPVIAPRLGAFPEIIEDGVNGLLFEPGNADDLAAKIQTLWHDPERSTRMGATGNLRLREKYSPERYYTELMKIYEEVTFKPSRNER